MRFHHRGPKCGGRHSFEEDPSVLATNAHLVLRREGGDRGEVAMIQARVCEDCGFVEFYRAREPLAYATFPETARIVHAPQSSPRSPATRGARLKERRGAEASDEVPSGHFVAVQMPARTGSRVHGWIRLEPPGTCAWLRVWRPSLYGRDRGVWPARPCCGAARTRCLPR